MKNLTTSSFKAKTFNLEKMINEVIRESKTNPNCLKDILEQCGVLNDAVVQKKTEIINKLNEKEKLNPDEILHDFFAEHRKLQFDKVNLNDVIESYQTAKEKKNLLKILKIINEIKNGYFDNFEFIMKDITNGDLKEALTIAYVFVNFHKNVKSGSKQENRQNNNQNIETGIGELDNVRKERILTYKDQFISTILNTFERGQKEMNVYSMKSAIEALNILGKEEKAIESFVKNCKIFSLSPDEIILDAKETINLDFFNCSGPFYEFINEMKSIYDEEFTDISIVFVNNNQIISKLHQMLFNDIISNALSKYLSQCDKIEYLFALYHSYVHLKKFINHISSFYSFINLNLKELYEKHLLNISNKENFAVDQLILCMNKNPTVLTKKYLLINDDISEIDEKDNRLQFIKLVSFYDYFTLRNDVFKYDSDDYFSIKKHYIHAIENLITRNLNVFSLRTFDKLTEYYFILKKINLESKQVKEKLNLIFNNYVGDRNREIKVIISQDKNSYSEQKSEHTIHLIKKLDLTLRSEHKKIKKHVHGANSDALFMNIVVKIDYELRKYLLKSTYTIKQGNMIKSDLKNLIKSLRQRKVTETPLNNLKEKVKLLAFNKEELKMFITQSDDYTDTKKWLKARTDYQDVKNILESIY